MNDQEFQFILEQIEDSKNLARIKMDRAENKEERDYYCGNIGGLQLAKQHLEKLQRMEEWR